MQERIQDFRKGRGGLLMFIKAGEGYLSAANALLLYHL